MGHVPHLFLPGPWDAERVEVSPDQTHHLQRVLRLADGQQVGYTDGKGLVGTGTFSSDGMVLRGQESAVPRPSDLIVVAAPPDNKDRARFLVEKLAELGVAELRFLRTDHGQGRPPRRDRALSWAASGLEQSRGAWLLSIPAEMDSLTDLRPPYVVCDPAGSKERPSARTVVIGPEGGWAEGEVPDDAQRWDLGDTVLRLETAALVAAARLI
jgi:16S rRNA (uracil1498-N3)-methyltransferase